MYFSHYTVSFSNPFGFLAKSTLRPRLRISVAAGLPTGQRLSNIPDSRVTFCLTFCTFIYLFSSKHKNCFNFMS